MSHRYSFVRFIYIIIMISNILQAHIIKQPHYLTFSVEIKISLLAVISNVIDKCNLRNQSLKILVSFMLFDIKQFTHM